MADETVQPVAPIPSIFTKDASKTGDLHRDESVFITNIYLSKGTHPAIEPVPAKELEDRLFQLTGKTLPFTIAVLVKRLEAMCPEIEFSPSVIFLVSGRINSPGVAVLYAYSLYQETMKQGGPLSVEYMCLQVMPNGFPTDDHMRQIWDAQKGRTLENGTVCDNYIDHAEAWR